MVRSTKSTVICERSLNRSQVRWTESNAHHGNQRFLDEPEALGLIVPHMVRTTVGSDYRKLVIGCLFAGPALMVGADVGARLGMTVLTGAHSQIPVGIVTGLVGGPYFLYLMRKQEDLGEI